MPIASQPDSITVRAPRDRLRAVFLFWAFHTHDAQWPAAVLRPQGLIICATAAAAQSFLMVQRRRYTRWAGKYPPGSPAEWLADGHVTCNLTCLSGECDRRMVNVRLETLPQDQPWSIVGWRFVCKQCGAGGSVNIVPNWHDRVGRRIPFSRSWKT